MKYYARINQMRIVTDVINCDDETLIDTFPGTWIETFKDSLYRKNFAGIGYSYDYLKDAFIPIQPYPSWILDETTYNWEPPVPNPRPDCFLCYYWDESIINWVENTL
jgi:hypothetical protein